MVGKIRMCMLHTQCHLMLITNNWPPLNFYHHHNRNTRVAADNHDVYRLPMCFIIWHRPKIHRYHIEVKPEDDTTGLHIPSQSVAAPSNIHSRINSLLKYFQDLLSVLPATDFYIFSCQKLTGSPEPDTPWYYNRPTRSTQQTVVLNTSKSAPSKRTSTSLTFKLRSPTNSSTATCLGLAGILLNTFDPTPDAH